MDKKAPAVLIVAVAVGLGIVGDDVRSQDNSHFAPSAGAAQQQSPAVRLSSHLVTLTVTVTDVYGRFIRGLRQEHFQLFDDKIEQEIAFFNSADAPISFGIIYDTSGSMKGIINDALRALRVFMDTSHPDDHFFLIGFNSRPELLQDFTSGAGTVLNSLILVRPQGRTALYDAVYLGMEKVAQGQHAKKALLIISDGQDNNSMYTYRKLRDRVKESGVIIYGIGIVDLWDDVASQMRGREVLQEVTHLTGGRVFFPKAGTELVNTCAHIAMELRRQYSMGYYPRRVARDGRWHKIQVKVRRPKGLPLLQARAREGYYAN
jgi:Ca-activated chloride channel family protein